MNYGSVIAVGAWGGLCVACVLYLLQKIIDRLAWLVGRLQRAWQDSFLRILLDERDQHRRVVACRRREARQHEADHMAEIEAQLAEDMELARALAEAHREDIDAEELEWTEVCRVFEDTAFDIRWLRSFDVNEWVA